MAYKHMKVSVIEKDHKRALEMRANQIETVSEKEEREFSLITRPVNGLPVAIELAIFCDEIRAAFRGIEFAIRSNGKSVWRNGTLVMSEVWAYFPGDEYAVMRIGWCDYSVDRGATARYGIYARTITNEKYCDDKEQHYMMLADSPVRAFKNVKKAMRRYTPGELAGISYELFRDKVTDQVWNAKSMHRETGHLLVNHASFIDEMRGIVNSGYQFHNPAFAKAMTDMLQAFDAAKAKDNEVHHGYYVHAYELAGAQMFDVVMVYDIKNTTSVKNSKDYKTFTFAEMAEFDAELPNKLAALSMLEAGAFVEGLGLKESGTCWWVFK